VAISLQTLQRCSMRVLLNSTPTLEDPELTVKAINEFLSKL
jgi:hypothetical protein